VANAKLLVSGTATEQGPRKALRRANSVSVKPEGRRLRGRSGPGAVMRNPDGAAELKLFRAHLPAACGNPGSASLQSGNISNPLRFVANQQMSRWSANETDDP